MSKRFYAALDWLWYMTNVFNNRLKSSSNRVCPQERSQMLEYLRIVKEEINIEYPYYASCLEKISSSLFVLSNAGCFLSVANFGQLYIIINHLKVEPMNVQFWINIHPRISAISKELYVDGYFASAAEKVIKEVESRLREKFKELKDGASISIKTMDLIAALFSESGIFQFCDTTTESGKNYRKGVHQLFVGTFAAYRNPSAHKNLEYSHREAVEQIFLASQLMYILDKPSIN